MKILILTQIVPYPPDSGPKVKTYHVLRYLAEQGHLVTLVSFVRKGEERHLDALKPYCVEIYPVPMRRSRVAEVRAYWASLRSGLPFLITRDAKREMYDLVSRLLREHAFDVIHADQLTMAQYAVNSKQLTVNSQKSPVASRQSQVAGRKSPATIFDAHNAVWTIVERARQTAPLPLRPILALEARRIKCYEGGLIQQFDHTLTVSDVDRQLLLQAAAADVNTFQLPTSNFQFPISVIPIAVDTTRLQPVTRVEASLNIVTMGTLFYPPNADGVRWFIHQVYPLIHSNVPASSLTIIGTRPPKDIVEFATRHTSHVTLTGYVPDLVPYLECTAMIVVPVRVASGMRVRILEALARGIPVVTTTTGVEGIDAVSGEHLLVADTAEGFAEAVGRLLKDRELRKCLAQNGRRLAEEKYDWQVVLPNLEMVYQSLGH